MGECLSIIAYVWPHQAREPASTNVVRNRVMWRHSFCKKIYNSFSLAARSIISRVSVGGAHWVKCETLKHMVKFTEKWRRDCLLRKWERLTKLLWTKFFWNVPHSRTARRATVFCFLRETAKSVKSLGLKDNTTNQIRMKIYSVHIQTAWVETKTIKE